MGVFALVGARTLVAFSLLYVLGYGGLLLPWGLSLSAALGLYVLLSAVHVPLR